MTRDEIMMLDDDELYALSLERTNSGYYSRDANLAYEERRRRSGYIHMDNVSKRCSKYQADLDYYGRYCE